MSPEEETAEVYRNLFEKANALCGFLGATAIYTGTHSLWIGIAHLALFAYVCARCQRTWEREHERRRKLLLDHMWVHRTPE